MILVILNKISFSDILCMLTLKKRIKLSNPVHLLATGFGVGLFPWIPGTIGSLIAIPLWFLLILLPWKVYLLIIILIFFSGYLCQKTALDIGVHDHDCIVLDEFIGMWITLMALPEANWKWILIGLLLFRLFDIWKPWPIQWLDRNVQGGIGIIIDDVMAGAIASCVLWITRYC